MRNNNNNNNNCTCKAFIIICDRRGPEKTGLIYTKYTHSYYGAYLFCVHAI